MPSPICRSAVRIVRAITGSHGECFTGQSVESCTSSSCNGTARGFPDFDSLTNSVGISVR